jgi:predicted nucleotidyltransferase
MSKHGLRQEEVESIRKAFEKFGANADCLVVFGSRAKGTYRRGSDIDLAYKGRFCSEQKMRIAEYLEEETFLPYHFDIVEYEELENEALKRHIDRTGIAL